MAMATSATTATTTAASTCIRRRLPLVGINRSSTTCVNFAMKTLTRKFRIRSSAEVSSSAETAEASTEVEETEVSEIEVPKEPGSLISALNVEKALRGIAITDVDHYGTLGLQMGCSYDEVNVAYKKKVEELMNQGLEQEELTKKLDLLKDSYNILSSVQERRLYDWSLARVGNPDRFAWPFEVDITQKPDLSGTPPFQDIEDVGPTRLVGYFLIGWFIVGCVLSVYLNL